MKTCPRTRRKFSSELDELSYLVGKIQYWLYEREMSVNACRFAGRFRILLQRNAKTLKRSILFHVYSALLADLEDDLADLEDDIEQEIHHQERVVEMIRQLHETGGPTGEFDHERLNDEQEILMALHEEASGK